MSKFDVLLTSFLILIIVLYFVINKLIDRSIEKEMREKANKPKKFNSPIEYYCHLLETGQITMEECNERIDNYMGFKKR